MSPLVLAEIDKQVMSILTRHRPLPSRGKGMQLGKKSKATDIYEKVRGDLGPEADESAALVSPAPDEKESARPSLSAERESVHVTVAETISAKLSREGGLNSLEVKGDLQLRISDPAFTKVKLDLVANPSHGAQFRTHPNVDRGVFTNSKAIQLRDTSKRFPANNSIGVLRWRVTSSNSEDSDILPITFTVWVNQGDTTTVTVEYELTGSDPLRDVVVTIPYGTSEPAISSFDALYEVSGDSIDWNIGDVDDSNPTGSFEFESTGDDDDDQFFPMVVRFAKSNPFVDVDVGGVSLLEEGEDVPFSKEVKSVAEGYLVE